jgi:phosphoglycerate dehydrogenase-like enzyme
LDNIDLVATDKYNVKLGWTGGVNRRSVSEMTLCFMIGLSRHILFSSRNLVRLDDWNKNGGSDLSHQTVGIIGVGYIGKDLVTLLKPFGCRILVNDIIDQADYYQANGLIASSKEEIYAQADIVTVHTPLDETTRGFCNADTFRQMKETGYFINCARGGLVLQADLKQALMNGTIAGAAIDVFEFEPSDDSELINLPNLICTPHTGGSSNEAVLAMGRSAISHLVSHFSP